MTSTSSFEKQISSIQMHVTKRDGTEEEISFDKILKRIKQLCIVKGKPPLKINPTTLSIKIIDQLSDKITTKKIDIFSAELSATMATEHPDYNTLAGRIIISNHQKSTLESFSDTMELLYNHKNKTNNQHKPLLSEEFIMYVRKNAKQYNKMCKYERDFLIDYFGFKTLEKSYLMHINGVIVERIQHLWMRVAVALHGNNLKKVEESYNLFSQKYMTHATPTLFNAGTPKQQMSSCFLEAMEDDSIDGIFNTLKDCALLSKYAGGIGMHIHNIRSKGSPIYGTNGISNGIVPMLRVFNDVAKYVDQGGGKRHGSIAVYLEPWHGDIEDFLEMRKNHGSEDMKARDLFYALWIPDLFMKRVRANQKWTLMCPSICKGLSDVYGDEFETLYTQYEEQNMGSKTISAQELWTKIMDAQMETGTPYLLFKDHANKKSNQKNIGVIKSSNLCTEIMEVSTPEETAVCNLASIALPSFVTTTGEFDYKKLHEVSKTATYNLNRVIDINYYPLEKARLSNVKSRPIGLGVQGLADVYFMLKVPYNTEEAKKINRRIFETIYHGALEQSMELAKTDGAYDCFAGSPASQGILQFDLWKEHTITPLPEPECYTNGEWDELKAKIVKYGLRNSLLIAPMPTASTSQILGFNECFEPITSNIYSRKTNAGNFIIINRYLVEELIELNLWNETVKNMIVANNGSVQSILDIPNEIKQRYLTVWEMPMRHLIDMSVERGQYICQSQSLNLWMKEPDYKKLNSMHFYSWTRGLKTGIYYLRRQAVAQTQQFTIEPTTIDATKKCNDDSPICETCSA